MALATFTFQTALAPFAIGVVALLLAVALLVWNASARGGYTAPDAVIFSRPAAKLIGGAVILAACAFAAPFVGIDPNNGAFLALAFVGFFALVWCGQFISPTLTFYIANQQGLTRQALGLKRSLPWYAIDWVYPERKTTSYRAYGIVKMGQSTEHNVIVEAGPRQRIKIVVKAWLVGGDPGPLLDAIQRHATDAQFGFDKQPLVYQRRTVGITPRSD